MEKITAFRKGRIWVNVFETKHGELAVTINRSYKGKDGNWRYTPFFRPQEGDLLDLIDALCQFMEYREEQKVQKKQEIKQVQTLQRWVK